MSLRASRKVRAAGIALPNSGHVQRNGRAGHPSSSPGEGEWRTPNAGPADGHFVLTGENPAAGARSRIHLLGGMDRPPYDDACRRGRNPLPPPPPHRSSHEISPELVLVDRTLVPDEQPAPSRPAVVASADEVRDAMRRICELSDVNPPRVRRRRLVAYAGPVTLWAEAVLLVTAYIPLGAL